MAAPLLSLAVCTLYHRREAALRVFRDLPPLPGVELIVLAQDAPPDHPPETRASAAGGTVRFVTARHRGLSRNRNLALERASGQYVWFLDDDVGLAADDIRYLLAQIESTQSDVYVGRIRCSDCAGEFKNYRRSRQGLLGLLRVSSIEIVVNRGKINAAKVRFNEHLGLGTPHPSGEENVFLIDTRRAGLRFRFLPRTLVEHPCRGDENRPRATWREADVIRSKGIIARHVGGLRGLALCLWWGARAVQYNRSLRPLGWLISGFCGAGRIPGIKAGR